MKRSGPYLNISDFLIPYFSLQIFFRSLFRRSLTDQIIKGSNLLGSPLTFGMYFSGTVSCLHRREGTGSHCICTITQTVFISEGERWGLASFPFKFSLFCEGCRGRQARHQRLPLHPIPFKLLNIPGTKLKIL
jgi:hypothetical protein